MNQILQMFRVFMCFIIFGIIARVIKLESINNSIMRMKEQYGKAALINKRYTRIYVFCSLWCRYL